MAFQTNSIAVTYNHVYNNSSWVYLVDWILALILGIAFIFYFNRLIGFVVSLLLRVVVWKRYGVRINVESLRISFLGGRVFAKNLTVINADQSISILHLTLTWRYWLLNTKRLAEYLVKDEDYGAKTSLEDNTKLTSRLLLLIEGLEIFIYNRTDVYSNILNSIEKDEKSTSDNLQSKSDSNEKDNVTQLEHMGDSKSSRSSDSRTSTFTESFIKQQKGDGNNDSTPFFILTLLPLEVRIKKGAVVVGNATTPTILVASYQSASGIIDITKAPNKKDSYRVMMNLNYMKFQISLKPNIGYDRDWLPDPASTLQKSMMKNPGSKSKRDKTNKYKLWHRFFGSLNKIAHRVRGPAEQPEEEEPTHWRGLKRYLGEVADNQDLLGNLNIDEEYAKYSLILDSSATRIIYYYDIPGLNTSTMLENERSPEFGVSLELTSAKAHYGPWADRQRGPLQEMFFPALSRDAKPSRENAVPGAPRRYDGVSFSILAVDEFIIRVPIREPSKHKDTLKTYSQVQENHGSKTIRPFGWIELNMKKDSTIKYFTSYIPTKEEGWKNTLQMHMRGPELRSSVNHDVLFAADSHNLESQIGFPLKWNGKCNWIFDQESMNAKLFFLKEHTILMSDLFADFSSGPPVPYELFRPFVYRINWKFNGYKFYLNANDHNIINNPLDFNSNKYISFQGDDLQCEFTIPLYGQFTKSAKIEYKIFTPFTKMVLDTPPWHTANAFMNSNVIGKSRDFSIEGSYVYFSQVEINTSNFVVLKVLSDYVTLKFYGCVVKYLFTLRENYVGEHIHFKTFEEYADELDSRIQEDENSSLSLDDREEEETKEGLDPWNIVKTENDVDILFLFQVRHGLLLLPHNIYDSSNHVGLAFDSFDLDIRFSNYYSDLQAEFSPVKAVSADVGDDCESSVIFDIPEYIDEFISNGREDMEMDGFIIHAHRMFGLPPDETTYYSKWDFSAGKIEVSSDIAFLSKFATCIKTFAFAFRDIENCMDLVEPKIHNAGNFAFRCPEVQLNLQCEGPSKNTTFVQVELESILMTFNDIVNDVYSDKISAAVAKIVLRVFSDSEAGRFLVGYLKTSLQTTIFIQVNKFAENMKIQHDFISTNDGPYHRCPFILPAERRGKNYNDAYGRFFPSMTLIDASAPLTKESFHLIMKEDEEDESLEETASFSTTKSTLSQSQLHPTVNYEDECLGPSYRIDPEIKYLNLIHELGEVESFFTPKGLFSVLNLVKGSIDLSINTLMDSLEVSTVMELIQHIISPKVVKNTRFVSPELQFKFGDFIVKHEKEVFESHPKIPVINLNTIEPSFVLSSKPDISEEGETTGSEKSGALHIREVFLSISKPSDFVSPFHAALKDIEAWWEIDTTWKTSSFSLEEIDVEIFDSHIGWLIDFSTDLALRLKSFKTDLVTFLLSIKECQSQVVHMIAKAGDDFCIGHDTGVLTKPAYVLRSLKHHVRYFDSWKIVTRLRHILNSLPKTWLERQNILFTSLSWEKSANAYNEVLNIFSRWRHWEANEEERLKFFNLIFRREVRTMNHLSNLGFHFFLRQINLKLSDLDENYNYVDITNIDLLLRQTSQVIANNTDAANQKIQTNTEVILNVSDLKSKISKLLLSSFGKLSKKVGNGVKPTHIDNDKSREVHTKFITWLVHFRSLEQELDFPISRHILLFKDISFSGQFESSGYETCMTSKLNVSLMIGDFLFEIKLKETALFASAENISVVVASDKKSHKNLEAVSISLESMDIQLPDESEQFFEMLPQAFEVELPLLKNTFQHTKEPNENNSVVKKVEEKEHSTSNVLETSVSLQISDISWVVNCLLPLRIRGMLYDIRLSSVFGNDVYSLESFIQKCDYGLALGNCPFIDFENSQIFTEVKALSLVDTLAANVSVSLGYSKAFIPQFLESTRSYISKQSTVMRKIELAKSFLSMISGEEKKEEEKKNKTIETKSKLHKVGLKFKFINNYISLTSFIEKSKFAVELENTSLGIFNLQKSTKKGSKDTLPLVPFYGEFKIPTLRVSLVDRSIPIGLSNFVNLNLGVKIMNESDMSQGNQTLQIESQYCRICLSPQIIIGAVNLADKASGDLAKLFDSLKKRGDAASTDKGKSNQLFKKVKFSTIHLLSYNFCFGWLFGEQHKDFPGIILGAERFFAVIGEKIGKLTLMDAYMSIANGNRTTNFSTTGSDRETVNSASLPKMQLIYVIEEENLLKRMSVNIYGDELDVNFLTDSVLVLERTVSSISQVQAYFNNREKSKIIPEKLEETEENDHSKLLENTFSSVECMATFAGSNVLFYRLRDVGSLKTPPLLYLHSPAVKIATSYKYQKNEVKKHVIKCEALTSSSDNRIYSTCIPVILDMVASMKKMVHNTKSTKDRPTNDSTFKTNVPHKELAIKDLFKEIDLHVGVKIEDQKLALSCEPTAKVEAIVGIEGIFVQINTLNCDVPSMSIGIQFESTSASLQHIYSREISGSIAIKEVLATSIVSYDESFKILSSGHLTQSDAYINVKQFQDLILFKDIWFPDTRSPKGNTQIVQDHRKSIKVDRLPLAFNKSISSRFEEVSTTSALPWVVNFIVSKLTLSFDLGQSLGKLIFCVDKLSAISKRSADWTQDLKIGVDTVSLQSEGRLTGIFVIHKIRLHTSIRWNLEDGSTLTVPLILICGGVDSIKLKLSFDYHVFAIASLEEFSLDIYNKKNELKISKDHLFLTILVKSAELYTTSLAASNVLDIYHTVSRLIQENRTSYRETLSDSSKARGETGASSFNIGDAVSQEILETVRKLETNIKVIVGKMRIHIYPSTFNDSKVLIIWLDESRATFQQSEYTNGVTNQLDIQFNDLKVSLSVVKVAHKDFIANSEVDEFIKHALSASGGTIFVFPSFNISMRTFQRFGTSKIEYLYQSSFGGTVDIRWNLGSVNFIREMYSVHKRALSSRTEYRRNSSVVEYRKTSSVQQVSMSSDSEKAGKDNSNLKSAGDDIGRDINDTIDKVSSHSEFVYEAIAPPVIQAPQLKELGNATPPLEWFGLHRTKFPAITHQLAIVPLQRLIHEAEKEYSKTLGKA